MKKLTMFCLILLFVLSLAVAAHADHTYYIPYFDSTGVHRTGVAAQNTSDSGNAVVKFTYYDQGGNLLTSDTENLAVNGHTHFVVLPERETEGWMKVESDQLLSGLCFVARTDIALLMFDIAFIPELSKNWSVSHAAQDNLWDTDVFVCNPGSSSATVTLVFLDDDGNKIGERNYPVSASGSGRFPVTDLGEGVGSVNLSSNEPVAVFALYNNLKTGQYAYSGIRATPVEESGLDNTRFYGTYTFEVEALQNCLPANLQCVIGGDYGRRAEEMYFYLPATGNFGTYLTGKWYSDRISYIVSGDSLNYNRMYFYSEDPDPVIYTLDLAIDFSNDYNSYSGTFFETDDDSSEPCIARSGSDISGERVK